MKTYAFETINGFRFDVKASSIKSAVNKIKSIPHLLSVVTGYYYQYDKDGFYNFSMGFQGKIDFSIK